MSGELELIEVQALASFSIFRKGQVYAVLSDDPMLKTGYLRRLDAPVADTSGGGAAVPAPGDLDLGGRGEEAGLDGPLESEPSGNADHEGESGSATGVVGVPADEGTGEALGTEEPVTPARVRKTAKRSTAE